MRENATEWVTALNGRWIEDVPLFDNMGSALLFSRFFHHPAEFVGGGRLINLDKEGRRVSNNCQKAIDRKLRADLKLDEWLLALARFDYKCAYCGGRFQTLDHILPLSNGGGTTFANVAPACSSCNNEKGSAIWL